jgi:predicted PurR-regulated permease PerM
VLLAGGLVALALFLWSIAQVLLLAFGAVLVAIVIVSAAELLERYLHLPWKTSLPVAVLIVIAVLAGTILMFGAQIGTQLTQLVNTLPQSVEKAETWLSQRAWGEWLVAEARGLDFAKMGHDAATRFFGIFASALGVLGNAVLMLVAGIYMAAQPQHYRTGLLELLPPSYRERGGEVLDTSGNALRLWLVGQLISMAGVGLLTGIGLWIAGVPSPLALGLIMFIADFVPYVGPILGAVPAVLAGFSVGPETAGYALLVCLVAQQTENHLLQPLVQKNVASLPPMLALFATIAFGVVFGPLGLVFATPLALVAVVSVKMLYVEDTLDDHVEVPGRDEET